MSMEPRSPGDSRDDGCSYYPNDNLAQVIVAAWSNDTIKDDLLTFGTDKSTGKDNPTVWSHYPGQRDAMLLKTSEILEQYEIYLDKPVVLTVGQYKDYKAEAGEVVFVLPNILGKKPSSLPTARIAMTMYPCGI
jgi:hypothetical protein